MADLNSTIVRGSLRVTDTVSTSEILENGTGVVNKSVLTAKGDIIYASAAKTPTKLAINSTDGKVLTTSSSEPVWADNDRAGIASSTQKLNLIGAYLTGLPSGATTTTTNTHANVYMTDGTLYAAGLTGVSSLSIGSTNGNISIAPAGNNNINLFASNYSGTGKAYYKGKELVVVDNNNTGKIPLSYLPDVILGQLVFGGTVQINTTANPTTATATPSTNAKAKLGITDNRTITLVNSAEPTNAPETGWVKNEGLYYIVNGFDAQVAQGTFAGLDFQVGDWLISIGSAWGKVDNTDAVTGVKGADEASFRIGDITLGPKDLKILLNTGADAEGVTVGATSAHDSRDAEAEKSLTIVTRDTAQTISQTKTFSSSPVLNNAIMLKGKFNDAQNNNPTKNLIGFSSSNDLILNEEVTTNNILINGALFGPKADRSGLINLGDSSHAFGNLTFTGLINPNAAGYGLLLPSTASLDATSGSKTLLITDDISDMVTKSDDQTITGHKIFETLDSSITGFTAGDYARVTTAHYQGNSELYLSAKTAALGQSGQATEAKAYFSTHLIHVENIKTNAKFIASIGQGTSILPLSSHIRFRDPSWDNHCDYLFPQKGGTFALTDDMTIAANTSKGLQRDSSGNANAVAFNLCTVNTSTVKASIQYDAASNCIKFVF